LGKKIIDSSIENSKEVIVSLVEYGRSMQKSQKQKVVTNIRNWRVLL
jgi:hypothetical protein